MQLTTWAELEDLYLEELHKAWRRYPSQYGFSANQVVPVVGKMVAAFKAGTYSNDGPAIKAMARRLGIKPTYTELNKLFATLT